MESICEPTSLKYALVNKTANIFLAHLLFRVLTIPVFITNCYLSKLNSALKPDTLNVIHYASLRKIGAFSD
jgi:hypothetical protein